MIDIGYISDKGNVRKQNQDRILVVKNNFSLLCAVADGMGGLSNSSFASELAIKCLNEWWNSNNFITESENFFVDSLYKKINFINTKIFQYCVNNNTKTGTTLTVLYMQKTFFLIAYCGDTRLYHIRNGRVKQLTEDETLYNYYENYESDTIKYNPLCNKSVLISYIGKSINLSLSIKTGKIECGDIFIICTDGAYNYINLYTDDNLNKINNYTAKESVKSFAEEIKKQRASDNFSIVTVKYQ